MVDTEFWPQVVNQLPTEAEIRKYKNDPFKRSREKKLLYG